MPSDEAIMFPKDCQLPVGVYAARVRTATIRDKVSLVSHSVPKHPTSGLLARFRDSKSSAIQTLVSALYISSKRVHMFCFRPKIEQRMML